MQTTVETLSQLERRLNVAVPRAQIEGEVEKRLARLAKTVKLPGFRPGKVPLKMVVQQYGQSVRSDVISDAVQSSFNEAVREQNLRVAGYPRIEPRQGAEGPGDAFEFSAVFEIYPEITLGDLGSIPIERPQVEVTAADVDRTLEVLRQQRAVFEPVTRGAQAGDRALVDFTGTIDGEEFPGGQARDFSITLGEGRMLPEFEAALSGLAAGESRAFSLTFPADYHGKEVAGKIAQFSMTVKQVTAPNVPPLDTQFATAFGIKSGSVDELRAEVESNLKLELKRKLDAVLKEQALKSLRNAAQLTLPKSLVEQEALQLARRMAANLQQQGMKPEDIKLTPEMFRPQAEERVALGLILGEVVRRENLQARPEQVRALVQDVAQTYEQPDAVVRWHFEKPERLTEFEALAVEHNVVEWLLGQAKVTEVPKTFEALMGPAKA
ncbi:MAG TPA: trigger factor [Casimicrobiaceae bacterium]|nr:trigger factor [Casimicrobiaceae bacterium]